MPENSTPRERILESALDAFVERGYEEVETSQIARDARVSRGTLLFHFPSRERIILSLMDRFADSVEKKLLTALAARGKGILRVESALNACIEAFSQHRRQTKLLLMPAAALGAAFLNKQNEIKERFARHIQAFLDEAISMQEIPAVDTEVVAAAWMGAIDNLIMNWIRSGEPGMDRIRSALVPMLLHSVQYRAEDCARLAP